MRLALRLFLLVLPVLLPAGPTGAARGGADAVASVAGSLLVAEERLGDANFARSVVLMVHHDAEGAMGLVVNRRYGSAPLADLLRGLGREPGAAAGEVDLHAGGPVEPQLGFVLHGAGYATAATVRITAELAMTSDPQALADLARGQLPGPVRVLLGYAGWGPGQLEGEMMRRDWFTVPADAALVLRTEPGRIWPEASARRGTEL